MKKRDGKGLNGRLGFGDRGERKKKERENESSRKKEARQMIDSLRHGKKNEQHC